MKRRRRPNDATKQTTNPSLSLCCLLLFSPEVGRPSVLCPPSLLPKTQVLFCCCCFVRSSAVVIAAAAGCAGVAAAAVSCPARPHSLDCKAQFCVSLCARSCSSSSSSFRRHFFCILSFLPSSCSISAAFPPSAKTDNQPPHTFSARRGQQGSAASPGGSSGSWRQATGSRASPAAGWACPTRPPASCAGP